MITLKQICDVLNIPTHGDPSMEIRYAMTIDDVNFDKYSIGWCSDANIEKLGQLKNGNVLVSKDAKVTIDFDTQDINLIKVDNPRGAFAAVLRDLFVQKVVFGKVEHSTYIHESVAIDLNRVNLGCNVVIEENCIIGNRVSIGHNSVIKSHTIIADDVTIGSNCSIGGVGFGYEQSQSGAYELMPHIGNVKLEASVEIGNNVCIDRAVMGSTHLEQNVKVDNLVHIAHGVHIGKNSLIIANSMLAGSVQIGENVWVAPSSSIKQKTIIGDNALIGMGTVVLRNVNKFEVVVGVPAKAIQKK
ncbi:MAG: UDP-3-O-[3-hydroxymyristoyl] glucosamine N-acyltransferase [Crocinitomicaceae bacterium]|jgi:UDP-3-O-[3-hydroxymyristoyl] glucosamine N-acyltransferase